jgi:hypothetical protein
MTLGAAVEEGHRSFFVDKIASKILALVVVSLCTELKSKVIPGILAAITPTTPDPTPLVPLPFSSSNLQQLQQRVPWMLIPGVPMPPPNSGASLHRQWGWSSDQ